jgi:hypothetical protein
VEKVPTSSRPDLSCRGNKAIADDMPLSTSWRYMAREKTAIINVRVEPWIKEAAERAAKADHRTLTSLIEKLLCDHIELHDSGKPAGKRK